jgi:hypothetical protein
MFNWLKKLTEPLPEDWREQLSTNQTKPEPEPVRPWQDRFAEGNDNSVGFWYNFWFKDGDPKK